ncbi:MAG TPA: NAD-dependent epimerase/dehydratase family protein [Dermatophilaceae bacterium]|nr:NAD-dependent epimerase/dehydratase family protein [Dermatophilaceae bacterium]
MTSPAPKAGDPGQRHHRIVVAGLPGPVSGAVVRALRQTDPGGPPPTLLLHAPPTRRGDSRPVGGPDDPPETVIVDLTSPDIAGYLLGAEAVVFIPLDTAPDLSLAQLPHSHRAELVRLTETLATAAAAAGVGHLVAITSARVYGALPDNPVPLPDEAPRRASHSQGQAGDLAVVEDVLDRARATYPHLVVTSVRAAAVVAADVEGCDVAVSRYLEAPRLLVLRGSEPRWQFCHLDDLGSAVAAVLSDRLAPVVTVASSGFLTQAELEHLAGNRRIELADKLAVVTVQRLHKAGQMSIRHNDLDFLRHPWVVSTQRLLDSGWRPAHDNSECLQLLLTAVSAGRDKPTAWPKTALGTASAAVAIVATAVVRRRLKR